MHGILSSVVNAHNRKPDIILDIYGSGADVHTKYLQNLVTENNAGAYIRFMGYADVTEVYKNYEAFISASLGETLGLAVMEAIGSGTAVIGLNVKYGNRVLIHSGENGYLVDLNYDDSEDDCLVEELADKIVKLFDEKRKLQQFHQNSYQIAKDYLYEVVEKKWKKLLNLP